MAKEATPRALDTERRLRLSAAHLLAAGALWASCTPSGEAPSIHEEPAQSAIDDLDHLSPHIDSHSLVVLSGDRELDGTGTAQVRS